MQTFESARIQTAARAIGVAQPPWSWPRATRRTRAVRRDAVHVPARFDKIAMMAVEIMMARQITYFAARQKDTGRRCDLEAGMAKLLAARVAWAAADNACRSTAATASRWSIPVSRVLCDARILNIFEGAAEIQAQVIARRLLDGSNSAVRRAQRAIEILIEIVDVFQSDRESQQIGRAGRVRAFDAARCSIRLSTPPSEVARFQSLTRAAMPIGGAPRRP